DSPHLEVGLRGVTGEGLHQSRRDTLLICGEGIPCRYLVRPRRQLGVGGNDPEPKLALVGLLAILVPALVELPLEFIDPCLGGVVGRVSGAWRVVDEEGTVGRD